MENSKEEDVSSIFLLIDFFVGEKLVVGQISQAHLEVSGEYLGCQRCPFLSNSCRTPMFRTLQAHLELGGEDLDLKSDRSIQIPIEFQCSVVSKVNSN